MPQATEAEITVLGALLMGVSDTSNEPYELLVPDSFFGERHRRIFAAMLWLHENGSPVAIDSVCDELANRHELDLAGGEVYLAELLGAAASAANVAYHARVVAERAARRQLVEAGLQTVQDATEFDFNTAFARYAERLTVLEFSSRLARPSRLLTAAQVKALVKPEELLEGMLVTKSLAVLYGPSGSGKSFLALDFACSIATGFRWMGRTVIRGPVVYVAGEGVPGMGSRLSAWQTSRAYVGNPATFFLPVPAMLHQDSEQDALLHDIRALNLSPALVVVDTLARSMAGADENSAADMSSFIRGADRLRTELDTTVLIVHHMNKGGEQERGSTALRGAADTMIRLAKEDEILTLSCDKQKDSLPFENMQFSLKKEGDSAVFQALEKGAENLDTPLGKVERSVLDTLQTSFLENGASATQWGDAVSCSNGAFYKARTSLVRKGYVNAADAARGTRYTLTEKGKDAIEIG